MPAATNSRVAAADQPRARLLQDLVARINNEIYKPSGSPGFVFGIKCALEDLGLAGSLPAEPLTALEGPPRDHIRTAIAAIAASISSAL